MTEQERRIGVYVCHCGGNISDYVDVDQVVAAAQGEPGVVVARQMMFACSDSGQSDMERDIAEQHLDGLVVASCSPKLHVVTFRGVAKRAGLNPYEYTQVNVREQASWIHSEDAQGTTDKAIHLVKAGIARTLLTEPLEPIVVETTQRTLVIGGGVAGLRAAIGLADIGLGVFLVEREAVLGGWVGTFGAMYPTGKDGKELIAELVEGIRQRPSIRVFTEAEMISKAGTFGNYEVGIRVGGADPVMLTVEVGSIVVTTGVDTYEPEVGEYGYGIDGVVTLPEFKALIDAAEGPLSTPADRSAAWRTSTASAAVSPPASPVPTSTALATAAPPRSRHRSSSPLATRPSTSTTCIATCAPTASSRRCTRSPASSGPST